jgi:glycosyltransferase involved in cell wall biosynthesis
MKIAWFTPFAVESAIARCSQLTVRELSKQADVTVFTADRGDLLPTNAPVNRFLSADRLTSAELDQFDIHVYCLGNHFGYHGEIFRVSQMRPGLLILHDYVLQNFFLSYWCEHLRLPEIYALEMERKYGFPGRQAAERSFATDERIWESPAVLRFPLIETAITGALAVVVHSEFFLTRIRESFAGRALYLPLPFEIEQEPSPMSRRDLGVPDDCLLLVINGHINLNKRPEAVLRAIAQLQHPRERIYFVLAGPIAERYRESLVAEAERLNLQANLRFTGYLSDHLMRSWISAADLCINLRSPSMEGASGSLTEQLLLGKAVIACDSGPFAEVPEHVIRKIRPDCAIEDIAGAIQELSEPNRRTPLSAAASQYSLNRFRPESYARGLAAFIHQVLRDKPALQLADKLGREFALLGISSSSSMLQLALDHSIGFIGADD